MDEKNKLIESNKRANVETALKALVAAVPYLGGPLSSIWSDVQSARKEKRFLEFLEGIRNDLEDTKQQINKDFVSNEDFLDIFEETARKVIITRQAEKREAFRHILTNSILSSDVTYDEVEKFLHLVDRLSVEHIFLLKIFKDPVAYDEQTGGRVGKGGGITTSINQIMQKLLPDWDEATIVELLSQLESERLVQNLLSRFKTAMSDRGIYHLNNTLTPKGVRFCHFVLD